MIDEVSTDGFTLVPPFDPAIAGLTTCEGTSFTEEIEFVDPTETGRAAGRSLSNISSVPWTKSYANELIGIVLGQVVL